MLAILTPWYACSIHCKCTLTRSSKHIKNNSDPVKFFDLLKFKWKFESTENFWQMQIFKYYFAIIFSNPIQCLKHAGVHLTGFSPVCKGFFFSTWKLDEHFLGNTEWYWLINVSFEVIYSCCCFNSLEFLKPLPTWFKLSCPDRKDLSRRRNLINIRPWKLSNTCTIWMFANMHF